MLVQATNLNQPKYVVNGLRKGSISPDRLPIQFIIRDGERIAFDNRSFTALTRAGLNPTKLINVTGYTWI